MNAQRKDRGTILFLVIIFSFLVGIIGATVIYVLGLEELYARAEVDVANAVYLSESALEQARTWIFAQQRFHEDYIAGHQLVGGPMGTIGTYYADIYPNPADAGQLSRRYVIFSSGTAHNYLKTMSIQVEVSSAGANGMFYKITPFSYKEQPVRRL